MAASALTVNPMQAALAPLTVDTTPMGTNCSRFVKPFTSAEKPIQVFVPTVGKDSSMVPLEVCKFDTITSLKIRIQTHFVDQQLRVCAGKELMRDEWLHLVLLVAELDSLTVTTVNGNSFVYKVWQAEDSTDLHKSIANKKGALVSDLPVVTLKGEQLEDTSIKEEFCLKGESVLCLCVHRPKVHTKFVGRKDLELSFTSADDTEEGSCPSFKVGGEGQYQKELKHGFQQPATLLLPSRYPISFDLPNSLKELIELVKMGLHAGQVPSLTCEGSGGVYLMKDECGMRNIAVFKPMDEEPMSVNNPRGYSTSNHGEGLKKGTRSGEGAIREVAAYVLDHPVRGGQAGSDTIEEVTEGFSGVPPTTIVRCYHEAFRYEMDMHKLNKAKKGSLQQFVNAISSCEDMGSSSFPVSEVHKITVLDLRLANTDRNGGNILVCKGKDGNLKLVPIDHGYCLPEKFEDCSFEWLYWPQAQQPYAPSTLAYIDSLNAEEDIALLLKYGWTLRPKVLRTFRISTMLLKKGAAAGLTPFEIGSIMCRSKSFDVKSPIELILEKVEARNLREHAFIKAVAKLVDEHIAMMKKH